jgi:hypothetical protein
MAAPAAAVYNGGEARRRGASWAARGEEGGPVVRFDSRVLGGGWPRSSVRLGNGAAALRACAEGMGAGRRGEGGTQACRGLLPFSMGSRQRH